MSVKVVFIITCYTSTTEQYDMLLKCIKSVSEYHPDAAIQVLDDNDTFTDCIPVPSFCKVEKTQNPGCGEVNAYTWAIQHQLEYDHFIYIHDSCKLINRIPYRLDDKHFKQFWNVSINSHLDTNGDVIDSIMRNVHINGRDCLAELDIVRKGNGNLIFGAMAAFDRTFLQFLDTKTNFNEIAPLLKGRPLRCFFERLLYIFVWIFSNDQYFYHNTYCGHIHDHTNGFHNKSFDIYPNNNFIVKVWQGR
jgi:hypothetical protein